MLEISKLTKVYGSKPALTAVDLSVPPAVVFGLLGPNGAGKTTLIRIINQIIEADSGVVFLDGSRIAPADIRKIGYLPEERGLYKKMKVWDQLIYFARLKGRSAMEASTKVNKWLDKLDMSTWKSKKIEDLSKGMAQKVQFIATVIHEPRLLILDEPFSGFDPVNAEIIKNEILELKDAGTTVILSTHRMESVELLCDRVAMINKSKKILDGTVREVKASFRPEVYHVSLSNLIQPLPSTFGAQEVEPGLWQFETKLRGQTTNAYLSELMLLGEVRQFEEVNPTMEEIFIHQVKTADHG